MPLFKSIKFQTAVYASFMSVAVLWIVHIVTALLRLDLGWMGILPRTLSGLKGILLAPFVHDNFGHLFHNSMPMLVMVGMITYFYRRVAWKSIIMMTFLTGLAVWAFARPVFHIGASGVVYALVTFVFFSGLFRRNIKSIILALVVTILYSGMAAGILPNQEGISWESHLFGALVGLYVAYFFKDQVEKDDDFGGQSPWERQPIFEEEERAFFLNRDTFDKTKAERAQELQRLHQLREEERLRNLHGFRWNSDDTSPK